jgi:hypothetical protein
MSIASNAEQTDNPIEGLVFVQSFATKVAGCRYQTASAAPGEQVHLVREPDNAADANAVAVHNMAGQRVGYLFREIAEYYAESLDYGVVRLFGRLAAPGEPDYDPSRARSNPTLFIWAYKDEARLAEVLAQENPAGETNQEPGVFQPFKK